MDDKALVRDEVERRMQAAFEIKNPVGIVEAAWSVRAAGMDTVDELAALWRAGAEVHGLDFGHDPVSGEGSPGGQHIEASGYNPPG